MYHLDVEQAFIRADLDCNFDMRLPPAFSEKSGQVVHLTKGLFGLKQAGRMSNALLVHTVVFDLMNDETVILVVAVRVDDLFVVGEAKEAAEFHDSLNNKFPTNMVGELSWYTGCAFDRNFKDGTIKMSQTAFVEEY